MEIYERHADLRAALPACGIFLIRYLIEWKSETITRVVSAVCPNISAVEPMPAENNAITDAVWRLKSGYRKTQLARICHRLM